MTLGINPRFYLLDSSLNAERISFQQYSENAEIMAEVQIRNAHYIRHHIYADHEMGLPEDGWRVYVDLLLGGTPQQVETETRRIIGEVKPVTRRFIMREANNLAPCTPPENIAAMYEAVRQYGVY